MSEIKFIFDDITYKGHHGEPMSAALLRSGLLTITNSTYHGRPRGIIGLGVEEPNATAWCYWRIDIYLPTIQCGHH